MLASGCGTVSFSDMIFGPLSRLLSRLLSHFLARSFIGTCVRHVMLKMLEKSTLVYMLRARCSGGEQVQAFNAACGPSRRRPNIIFGTSCIVHTSMY